MMYDARITLPRRAIIARYGAVGFAAYWYLLAAYEETGTIDRQARELTAAEFHCPLSTIDAVCFDFGAFRVEGKDCKPLDSDTDAAARRTATERAKAAAAKRWEQRTKAKERQARRKAKAEQPTETEQPMDASFVAFLEWMATNCPYLSKPSNIQQMTAEEFGKLKAQFGSTAIAETLLQMENRKDKRKQYTNLYRALLNWLKNNTQQHYGNNSTSISKSGQADAAKRDWSAEIAAL